MIYGLYTIQYISCTMYTNFLKKMLSKSTNTKKHITHIQMDNLHRIGKRKKRAIQYFTIRVNKIKYRYKYIDVKFSMSLDRNSSA